jgi:hypothetical protein
MLESGMPILKKKTLLLEERTTMSQNSMLILEGRTLVHRISMKKPTIST